MRLLARAFAAVVRIRDRGRALRRGTGADRGRSAHLGAGGDRRRSTPASRPSRTEGSAPPTSSSTTPPTPCTSDRPPTAPERAATPRPTVALGFACPSAHRSRSAGRRARARWSTTRGSRCRPRARPTRTRARSTTSALVRLEPGRLRQGQPLDPVLGRPHRHRHQRHGPGRQRVLVRELEPARRGHPAEPEAGVSLGDNGNGWSHDVYTATPGIPGDSGSAFLNSSRRGAGCAQHRADRTAGRLERCRRRQPRDQLHELALVVLGSPAGERHAAVQPEHAANVLATAARALTKAD